MLTVSTASPRELVLTVVVRELASVGNADSGSQMVLFTQPLSLVSQVQVPLFCLRQGSEYLVEFFEGQRTQSFQLLTERPANT